MFGGNQPRPKTSGLLNRLNQLEEGYDQKGNAPEKFNREVFLQEVLPEAQKKVQESFAVGELADRLSPVTRQKVGRVVNEIVEGRLAHLPKPTIIGIVKEIVDDILGYGPLEPFFTGPDAADVTEIIVNGPNSIHIERGGKTHLAKDGQGRPLSFRSVQHVRDVLEKMLAPTGRRIDLASPRVSARLPDGSRLMAHIAPCAVDGVTFTVRRFRQDITPEMMLQNGTLNREILDFLAACVRARLNIFLSGGTGSGKTAALNVLASFIPEDESIITIEDPAELQLQHPNVRRLEARPPNVEGKGEITQRMLVADALRMAPKRIIVGECRQGEAFDMLQAMNTGHDGSLSTCHANSADDMLNTRLVNMVLMAEMGLPPNAVVGMIASAVDLVVHIVKDRTGRRRIDHIVETVGVEERPSGPAVATRPIYQWNGETWVRAPHPFTRAVNHPLLK
ncbi:MAG: CpaF family protein [Thermoanaerobacterales bacterium]|nr:CpaF family protein [Thermoanaerobacterales bacterium]